jgi:hypothetical protein
MALCENALPSISFHRTAVVLHLNKVFPGISPGSVHVQPAARLPGPLPDQETQEVFPANLEECHQGMIHLGEHALGPNPASPASWSLYLGAGRESLERHVSAGTTASDDSLASISNRHVGSRVLSTLLHTMDNPNVTAISAFTHHHSKHNIKRKRGKHGPNKTCY